MVKNLPVILKTWIQSLGGEDPSRVGNGNPLQYSCLENPMDRGACSAYSPYGCKELHMTKRLTLMAESEELKSLLIKVKEERENVDLKLNIQKMKIMASGPINHFMENRWGNNGNSDRLFWGAPKSLQP